MTLSLWCAGDGVVHPSGLDDVDMRALLHDRLLMLLWEGCSTIRFLISL